MSAPAPPRVLIVEDDRTIVGNLVEYLEARGLTVDSAHDGAAALARLASDTYDVIVLDLGLPRADGLQVLQHLRRRLAVATPVLVLTARDALASKAEAFELGADDYVVKPFALAEIEMRIRALHRRARGAAVEDVRRAGPLALDRRTREVRVGGVPLKLAPRGMQILELLLQDPGRVVTRAELEAALWPHDQPTSDALRSQIHLLRQALAQAGYDGLETVHGVGYRLRTEVSSSR
ncbi:response regulator transcription factor [Betaproteobacteria bacterium PRO7]|jgi:DNA-binding response OmpR family regulator|nr:response regulator transcription factor [Betaproteobacteria bacterium PRO7]GIL05367.1 MAG: DNA-binding response regulator [Betaproteobacteria bacterium]